MNTIASTEEGSPTRRRLFQALSLGGVLAAVAAARTAQAADAPPKKPTDDDVAFLQFAAAAELAAVEAYNGLTADEATAGMLNVIHDHHVQYASALSGLLGTQAPKQPNAAVLEAVAGKFGGDLPAALKAAAELEDVLAQSHLALLGSLVGTDGAALVSSIAMIEGRHAVALGLKSGATDFLDPTGLQPVDAAIRPDTAKG